MTDKGRRFSKGVAIALAVHLVVAALLGVFGYRFTQRPPQILEVTLGGGGGGGGKGSESERQTSPPAQQPKQQMAKPKADDIVDQKQKPQPRREEQPQPKQRERATSEHAQSNVKSGEAGAAGSGSGSGAGSGSGSGAGQGSGAGVPVTPPYLVASTDPRYPPAARNREIEGTVYVKMLVNDGGSVESAFVARSSGNDALDGAAVEAVYNWRFSPAKDTLGSPVRCYITMPVNFVLH